MKERESAALNEYGLNENQELFCQLYIGKHCGNASAAYSEAYNVDITDVTRSVASRLLTNAKVIKRLTDLREKAENKGIMTIVQMQQRLQDIITQEMSEEVIVIEGTGDGKSKARTVRKKASMKDINKAIELLAKMKGAFNDSNVNVNVTPTVIIGNDELED